MKNYWNKEFFSTISSGQKRKVGKSYRPIGQLTIHHNYELKLEEINRTVKNIF